MSFETLLLKHEGAVATVTINRPEVRNCLNRLAWRELLAVFEELDRTDAVRAVIVTGAGEQAFCAGNDINDFLSTQTWDIMNRNVQAVFNQIEDLRKPVIAAVNGYALGGGCELALACDIRIAADHATFGQPEVRLGILPGAGGTQRLPLAVGAGWAKELIFAGDRIDAATAERIGLVNRVLPVAQLIPAAFDLANRIAERAPLAARMAKAAINLGLKSDRRAGLAYEQAAQTILFTTEDRQEGTRAFLEKRPARFQGR